MLKVLRNALRVLAIAMLSGCGSPKTPAPTPAEPQPSQPAAVEAVAPIPATAIEIRHELRAGDWFEDISATAGVDFVYQTGADAGCYFILESLGGGAALLDFDHDGNLDLGFPGGGTISKDRGKPQLHGLGFGLFRSVTGSQSPLFRDVSVLAGVDTPADYSHGVFVADFNSDGFKDFLVTCFGSCRLFQSNGDGTFLETSSAVSSSLSRWWTGAAWGDIDRDGFPDLFLTAYLDWLPENDQACKNSDGDREVCGPRSYRPADDMILRNHGDGQFEDVSETLNIRGGGNGLAVLSADLNGDAKTDFYVANDESDNYLYLGQADGTLLEVAHTAGVAVNQYGMHDGSMGLDAGDYDRDGLMDLWVTNFELEDNSLYRNLGDQLFQQTTNIAGLAGRSRLHVGFGTALEDFNRDGWLDIFVANGHVFYRGGQLPYLQLPQLFMNNRSGRYDDVSQNGGTYFLSGHSGRGTAAGDFNNDGSPDLVVTHQNDRPALLLNRSASKDFLSVELVGTRDNRDGFGAVVVIESETGKISRPVRSGAGYLSSFDPRISFAGVWATMPPASTHVTVVWPDGSEEVFENTPVGSTEYLVQGRGVTHVRK